MDFRKDADGMAVFCEGAGFRNRVAFFIDIFCIGVFGAVPDKAEGFEFTAVRFDDIRVINMDDRFVWEPFADWGEIGIQGFARDAFIQMPGEAFNRIDLFRMFVECIHDVGQKAAARSEHTVGHIGGKFFIGFGELSGNFIRKPRKSSD